MTLNFWIIFIKITFLGFLLAGILGIIYLAGEIWVRTSDNVKYKTFKKKIKKGRHRKG